MIDTWSPPRLIARLLGRLPQRPPSAAVATMLNLGLASRFDRDALARLRDRVVRIVVRDAGIVLTLRFDGRRFRTVSAEHASDVTIAASAWDFGLLATRKEDPDSLFFARRLTMEGDTELGLIVRNMLDAVDLTPLTGRIEHLVERLSSLMDRATGRGHDSAVAQESPRGSDHG